MPAMPTQGHFSSAPEFIGAVELCSMCFMEASFAFGIWDIVLGNMSADEINKKLKVK